MPQRRDQRSRHFKCLCVGCMIKHVTSGTLHPPAGKFGPMIVIYIYMSCNFLVASNCSRYGGLEGIASIRSTLSISMKNPKTHFGNLIYSLSADQRPVFRSPSSSSSSSLSTCSSSSVTIWAGFRTSRLP